MAHIHGVYDTDTHFSIDPLTRQLKYETEKMPGIVQYDHNSQVLTFEVPRYTMDGHDMSLCDKVRVHYINIDTITKEKRTGLYDVEDLQVAADGADVVLCSWPISRNATQLVGNLAFALRLACTENGEEVYGLSTVRYDKLTVSGGVHNDEAIVEEYADILDDWEARIQALEQGGATDEQIAAAVEAYMAEHPVSGGNVDQGSGLTAEQIIALDGMFKIASFTADPTAAYAAFKTAFGIGESGGEVEPDEPGVITYTVTSGLTNVTSTNPSAVVNEGENYLATLKADNGYEIETVTVTMGGVDITATAYAGGVVNIASVIGNVVVTASAVLSESGDDSGGDGLGTPVYTVDWAATSGVSIGASGVALTDGEIVTSGQGALVYLSKLPDLAGKTIVAEFGDCERQGTAHGRVITWNTGSEGVIYRNTGYWGVYADGVWIMSENSDPNIISINTMKVFVNETYDHVKVTVGDTFLLEADCTITTTNELRLFSGSSAYYNAVLKSIKIYEGDV